MRVRTGWKRNGYAAPTWAAEQRLGSVGLKATLLVLSTYADEDYTCYPGQERIADETEQSSRQVRRQLEILEEVGLIARTPRYDKGHRITDRFALNLDIAVEAEDVSAAKARIEDRKAGRRPIQDTMSGKDPGAHTGHGEQFIPDTGDSSYRTSDVRGTTSRTTSRTSPSLTLAKEGRVVGAAEPFTFNVVERLGRADTESWAWLSQNGTPEQVLAFLNAQTRRPCRPAPSVSVIRPNARTQEACTITSDPPSSGTTKP